MINWSCKVRKKNIVTAIIFALLIYCFHDIAKKYKKRKMAQQLVEILSQRPEWPEPMRVSNSESNYYHFISNAAFCHVTSDDIISSITTQIMSSYISPVINYEAIVDRNLFPAMIFCGELFVSNMVAYANGGLGNETQFSEICSRYTWFMNGLRQENLSSFLIIPIMVETDLISQINHSNRECLLQSVPILRKEYLLDTCRLLRSEIHELLVFENKSRRKKLAQGVLEPVLDLLNKIINASEPLDYAELIVEAKKIKHNYDKDMQFVEIMLFDHVRYYMDSLLIPELRLHQLKKKLNNQTFDNWTMKDCEE